MVTYNQTLLKSTQQKNNYLAFPLNLISFTQFVYFFLGHSEQVSQQVCFKTATQRTPGVVRFLQIFWKLVAFQINLYP